MSRAHPLLGVDAAVVPADELLDPVRAHLPGRDPSFVWAPDPARAAGPGRRRKRPRARTGRTGRLRLMVKDLEHPRRAEPRPKTAKASGSCLRHGWSSTGRRCCSSAKALTITRGRRVPRQPPGSPCTAWSAASPRSSAPGSGGSCSGSPACRTSGTTPPSKTARWSPWTAPIGKPPARHGRPSARRAGRRPLPAVSAAPASPG